jgi:serine/threonine-protein kinase
MPRVPVAAPFDHPDWISVKSFSQQFYNSARITGRVALAPGTRLGAYEIVALIGSGGMGEVYRARDGRLNRDVAIKVLPADVSADHDRLARFEREAQALASLNHPNIAHIHGVDDSSGAPALVMELVEGPTLADRIAKGPIPLDDARAIAKQIAEALEAAHEQGIVHRDLKPANIKVRGDGTVKLLDFGLAKALDPTPSGAHSATMSPTFSVHGTRAGLVLGTAAYMAPEQARGQSVDRRADIWAFGCVLFEMLTGTTAFAGATHSDIIANILHTAPDWKALPPSAVRLRGALEHCLEKDVRRRLRDIGDAALFLDDAVASPSPTVPPVATSLARVRWAAPVVAGAIVGAGAVALFQTARRPTAHEPLARFQLAAVPGAPFVADESGKNVAISPDGSTMVFTSERGGSTGLVVQRFDELQGRPLAGTDGGRYPMFSPDGKTVAFATVNELKRVSVGGGPSSTICVVNPYFNGASWGPDGTIVFAEFSFGLFRVSASGGQPERMTIPNVAKQENAFATPFVLPDGQTILYTVVMTDGSSLIAARHLGRGATSTVVEDGFGPMYLPSGYLVFGRGDELMAVRFDASTVQMTGSPVAVEGGVVTQTANYAADLAVAANGTAVYGLGHFTGKRSRIVWTDRHGARVGTLIKESVEFPRNLRISPDGRRVVLTIGPPSNGQIWVYDLSGAAQPQKLTFRDHGAFPVWSPDGRRIAFLWRTTTSRLSWIAADGSSDQPETIRSVDDLASPLDWSPDGAFLLYGVTKVPARINVLSLSDGKAGPWLATQFSDWGGRLSPNGRWLAYATDQTGALEVWVRPFPGPGAPVRISSNGGRLPMWSRDGKELFFSNGPQLLSARVTADGPEFRAAAPQLLFTGGFTHNDSDADMRFIDVAPDGRFLMIEPEPSAQASIVVSPHWAQELKRLLPDK